MHADPVVAALHGGDDYELLFTVPLDQRASRCCAWGAWT